MSEDERLKNTPEDVPRDAQGRWLPGQSANPNGRPKGRSLTSILNEILESETSDILGPDGKPMKWADVLVRMTLKHACQGNGTCLKEVWERKDGKVPERHEVKLGGDWSMEPVETTTPPPADAGEGEVAHE